MGARIIALKITLGAGLLLLAQSHVFAQQPVPLPRLPEAVSGITPPTARVTGLPGNMRITERSCRSLPLEETRRRIVNAAAQEWAYFGFGIDKQPAGLAIERTAPAQNRARRPGMSTTEAVRLADSIAGYWAATPDSDWILQRQNQAWSTDGAGVRWRDAWSAAFISWVMCESGLGTPQQFKRAIAHHTYIDQAILASERKDDAAAFLAYTPGEAAIAPGDLLCRGSRPAYQSIAERRAQLGVGARTHCDIVVKVDEEAGQIMAIGGNVRGSVRMKVFPAVRDDNQYLRPLYDNGRIHFAHLQLKSPAIEADALDQSPSLQKIACSSPTPNALPAWVAAPSLPAELC
jgi:hypothetical protein